MQIVSFHRFEVGIEAPFIAGRTVVVPGIAVLAFPGTGGVFPFGLGRQTIRFCHAVGGHGRMQKVGPPYAECIRLFPRDAYDRVVVITRVGKVHAHIRLVVCVVEIVDPYCRIGVDIDNLYISQPDNGEQALEIAETMARSGAIDIIVVDSVAALVPRQEIEGDMGDSHVGLQARLMSQALRKLTPVISKSNCIVIFINQLREKVGVMFGNPETTTGGRALKFYASVRMDVRKTETLKQSGEMVGNRTRIKVVKNKVAPPFREAEFDIMFGKGISKEGDVLDLAASVGIVQKSGAWFAYGGDKIGQGRDAVKELLKNDDGLRNEIEAKVREAMKAPKQ